MHIDHDSPDADGSVRSAGFRRFWSAAAASNLGDGVRLSALPLLAIDLTTDARLIAGVTAMNFLPWIVIGPYAGVLVDRVDRRRLMVVTQLVRAAAVTALATMVATAHASIWSLYAVALVVGAGETIVDTAAQAAVPRLVGSSHLETANARITTAEIVCNDMIGVTAGAALFAWAASSPFYVDSATFAVGALLLVSIRQPLQLQRDVEPRSVHHDLVEGVRFLIHHRFLRPLALSVAATNVALYMGLSVLVIHVTRELGASNATYGVVLGLGAVGGLVAAITAGPVLRRVDPATVLRWVHVPFIASAVVYATSDEIALVAAAFGLSSLALVYYQIPSRAMRQRVTPDAIHGRVVAAFRIFGLGGPVFGAAIGGSMAQHTDTRLVFAASAATMVIAGGLVRAALRDTPTSAPVPTRR